MNGKHDTPCAVCLYHLGIIKTFVCPCPQCRAGGFKVLKELLRQVSGGTRRK